MCDVKAHQMRPDVFSLSEQMSVAEIKDGAFEALQIEKIQKEVYTLGVIASKNPQLFDREHFWSTSSELMGIYAILPESFEDDALIHVRVMFELFSRLFDQAPLLRSYVNKGGCFPVWPFIPPLEATDDEIAATWSLVLDGLLVLSECAFTYHRGYMDGLGKDRRKFSRTTPRFSFDGLKPNAYHNGAKSDPNIN